MAGDFVPIRSTQFFNNKYIFLYKAYLFFCNSCSLWGCPLVFIIIYVTFSQWYDFFYYVGHSTGMFRIQSLLCSITEESTNQKSSNNCSWKNCDTWWQYALRYWMLWLSANQFKSEAYWCLITSGNSSKGCMSWWKKYILKIDNIATKKAMLMDR
jgi:hypothetical protein